MISRPPTHKLTDSYFYEKKLYNQLIISKITANAFLYLHFLQKYYTKNKYFKLIFLKNIKISNILRYTVKNVTYINGEDEMMTCDPGMMMA